MPINTTKITNTLVRSQVEGLAVPTPQAKTTAAKVLATEEGLAAFLATPLVSICKTGDDTVIFSTTVGESPIASLGVVLQYGFRRRLNDTKRIIDKARRYAAYQGGTLADRLGSEPTEPWEEVARDLIARDAETQGLTASVTIDGKPEEVPVVSGGKVRVRKEFDRLVKLNLESRRAEAEAELERLAARQPRALKLK